jgi:hypothetical protein
VDGGWATHPEKHVEIAKLLTLTSVAAISAATAVPHVAEYPSLLYSIATRMAARARPV